MDETKEETSENSSSSEAAQNGRSQEQIQAEKEAQKYHRLMLMFRGIRTPCTTCNGYGVRAYGSTSTWMGGIGGAAITNGTCDRCWGSGDESHKGPNLRKLLTMITPEQFRELYK